MKWLSSALYRELARVRNEQGVADKTQQVVQSKDEHGEQDRDELASPPIKKMPGSCGGNA